MRLTVTRRSAESEAVVSLDDGERSADLKARLDTPLAFLNHMLETLAWRACLNIEARVRTRGYRLDHVITEDLGLTLGAAFGQWVERQNEAGVNGAGFSLACIDEALARVVVSFEGRALLVLETPGAMVPELVEDMRSADLIAFLEGFAQGAGATLHVDLLGGRDPHHIWEAVFRAFGEALREALGPCPWRGRTTAGVKGRVDVESQWEG